jgi:hypothetical protein
MATRRDALSCAAAGARHRGNVEFDVSATVANIVAVESAQYSALRNNFVQTRGRSITR